MLKIEIASTKLDEINWSKNGKSGTLHKQEAYVYLPGEKYPAKISVSLPRGVTKPFDPGFYTIAPDSFFTGGYGELSFNLRLQPLKA
jgi:predicted transcriptional regulator